MSNMQSVKYAAKVAESRIEGFTALFRIVLIVEVVLAVGLLFFPELVLKLCGFKENTDLTLWGSFLLWSVAFQLPGLQSPVHSRIPAIIGIVGRLLVGLIYLFNGLQLLGVVTVVLALALGVSLHGTLRAVIDSRP